ncbi:hypothetical protein FTUN_7321 [Frigoriglobus tundricola]|uniref:Uncharacterized protein n=1 Tax=Frigoriglobus tundricola TaxID=2774151 RepID=A0A6M5Z2A2_9BACT|nr:hypothetical protein FTUN_7321 [Frigoriglobus tundricola]
MRRPGSPPGQPRTRDKERGAIRTRLFSESLAVPAVKSLRKRAPVAAGVIHRPGPVE